MMGKPYEATHLIPLGSKQEEAEIRGILAFQHLGNHSRSPFSYWLFSGVDPTPHWTRIEPSRKWHCTMLTAWHRKRVCYCSCSWQLRKWARMKDAKEKGVLKSIYMLPQILGWVCTIETETTKEMNKVQKFLMLRKNLKLKPDKVSKV